MSQSFAGEIRMFAGNYAPSGWAFCDGQVLSVAGHPELFATIGNEFGGDGKESFALPDLRGRIPVHRGNGFILAEAGGEEIADLEAKHVPGHIHTSAVTAGSAGSGSTVTMVADPRPISTLHGQGSEIAAGANNAHDNMQPYLALHFVIALNGGSSSDGPFIGEVRIFAGKRAPAGWKQCDGQSLPIEDHAELFSVIGTTYGGDGSSGFSLPDLRTRAALHAGLGNSLTLRKLGERGGSSGVTLSESQLPFHSHRIGTLGDGSLSGSLLISAVEGGYSAAGGSSGFGSGAPHNNMQPYLALNYCIAVRGQDS